MKTTLKTAAGARLTVLPMPFAEEISVLYHDPASGSIAQFAFPADMAGVLAQALECAAAAALPKPSNDAARLAAESFATGLGIPA